MLHDSDCLPAIRCEDMVSSSGQFLLLLVVGQMAFRASWDKARGSDALPNGLGHSAAARHAHSLQDLFQICIEEPVHGLQLIHVAQPREDSHTLLVLIARIRGKVEERIGCRNGRQLKKSPVRNSTGMQPKRWDGCM